MDSENKFFKKPPLFYDVELLSQILSDIDDWGFSNQFGQPDLMTADGKVLPGIADLPDAGFAELEDEYKKALSSIGLKLARFVKSYAELGLDGKRSFSGKADEYDVSDKRESYGNYAYKISIEVEDGEKYIAFLKSIPSQDIPKQTTQLVVKISILLQQNLEQYYSLDNPHDSFLALISSFKKIVLETRRILGSQYEYLMGGLESCAKAVDEGYLIEYLATKQLNSYLAEDEFETAKDLVKHERDELADYDHSMEERRENSMEERIKDRLDFLSGVTREEIDTIRKVFENKNALPLFQELKKNFISFHEKYLLALESGKNASFKTNESLYKLLDREIELYKNAIAEVNLIG
jgi:hypothetical protein